MLPAVASNTSLAHETCRGMKLLRAPGRRSGADAAHPVLAASCIALLPGCDSARSALAPAGTEAHDVAQLFWVMVIGAAIVWTAVIGVALYVSRAGHGAREDRAVRWLIVGGGVITPTLVLGALLIYGLQLMPQLREPGSADGLRVEVSGEQWWWRVRYVRNGGAGPIDVELANEIRLPLGRRTEFRLGSPDVIHSFWIPALGGKVDMTPGRITTLVLEPTRAGTYRGVCAEFCGASHAFMEFEAVVMEPGAFEAWLQQQSAPAIAPVSASARRGLQVFERNGCGACHRVRGTDFDGPVGPDLTHVGSRLGLAAGTLPNDAAGFRRWITRTHALKPDALMPAFDMLPAEELDDLALYMESLQ
jgi:cytochrome c oxidase subunit 2